MKRIHFLLLLSLVGLYSCKTPNVSYLQDLQNDQLLATYVCPPITLQPDDKLSIFVKSINPEITTMFNLVSGTTTTDQANSQRTYTVDSRGNIDLPQVGAIQVAGLTREQVADAVKSAIESRNLAKNITVIVEVKNQYFSVSGEVTRPGRYEITKDHLNLLEALVTAGDLTIQAERNNILVLRQEGEQTRSYRVNLTSSDSVVVSPAFQTRPGDYIYVQPNKKRQRETTVNGNSMLTPSFWISIASLIATLSALIFK